MYSPASKLRSDSMSDNIKKAEIEIEAETWQCDSCDAEVSFQDNICPKCAADISEVADDREDISAESESRRCEACGAEVVLEKTCAKCGADQVLAGASLSHESTVVKKRISDFYQGSIIWATLIGGLCVLIFIISALSLRDEARSLNSEVGIYYMSQFRSEQRRQVLQEKAIRIESEGKKLFYLSLLIMIIGLYVMVAFLILFYKAWAGIQDGQARTTPGCGWVKSARRPPWRAFLICSGRSGAANYSTSARTCGGRICK